MRRVTRSKQLVTHGEAADSRPNHVVFVKTIGLILILGFCAWPNRQAQADSGEDNQAFWQSFLDRFYTIPEEDIQSQKQLNESVKARLKERPDFVAFLQKRLREDKSDWVRNYAAVTLISVFGHDAWADCLYMLSDPWPNVRAIGRLAVSKYKMERLIPCLGAGLLSDRPLERLSSLRAISIHLGELGLPYYAKLLYDKDEQVAEYAARSLGSCRKDDALPHLLAYLKKRGSQRTSRCVTLAVLQSLQRLHGEPQVVPQNVPAAVRDWIKRLESSTENTRVK